MIVTINTDASYSHSLNVGAYAFWIVSNQGRSLKAGTFKEGVKNSTQAEAQCIINALHNLQKQEWTGITRIVINTDSLNSIHIFTKDKKAINRYNLKWGEYLLGIYNKKAFHLPPIFFKHVKAHKTKDDARSWVNDWCDQKAKEMLRNLINKK